MEARGLTGFPTRGTGLAPPLLAFLICACIAAKAIAHCFAVRRARSHTGIASAPNPPSASRESRFRQQPILLPLLDCSQRRHAIFIGPVIPSVSPVGQCLRAYPFLQLNFPYGGAKTPGAWKLYVRLSRQWRRYVAPLPCCPVDNRCTDAVGFSDRRQKGFYTCEAVEVEERV